MSNAGKSLTYDAIFLVAMGLVAIASDGAVRGFAVALAVAAILKAPYDLRVARRDDRNSGRAG